MKYFKPMRRFLLKEKLFLTIISIYYFIILWLRYNYHYISDDGIQYITLGHNLFTNGFYDSVYGVVPGWAQSPFFPVMAGFFSILFSPEWAGLLVSLISLGICAQILYKIIGETYNERMALLSVLVFLINPIILKQVFIISTEPLYTCLHMVLFYLMYRIIVKRMPLKFHIIVMMALVITALLLTRVEGILYLGLIPAILLFKKKYVSSISLIGLSLLFLIPYAFFVHSHSGSYNVFPKLKYNTRNQIVMNQPEAKSRLDNADFVYEEELRWYLLDNQTHDIYSRRILENDYYYQLKNETLSQRPKDRSLINLIKHISGNFIEAARVIFRSYTFPLMFLLFVIAGLIQMFIDKRVYLIVLSVWLFPTLYFMVSHVEARFFFVMAPYLSFIAALGVDAISRIKKIKWNLAIVLMALYFINASILYHTFIKKIENSEKYYQTAQFLDESVPEKATICSKNYLSTYYSKNRHLSMPIANINHLYKYLEKRNTKYILLGDEISNLRKEFCDIYNEKENNMFIKENSFLTDGQEFKLFRLK